MIPDRTVRLDKTSPCSGILPRLIMLALGEAGRTAWVRLSTDGTQFLLEHDFGDHDDGAYSKFSYATRAEADKRGNAIVKNFLSRGYIIVKAESGPAAWMAVTTSAYADAK